MYKTHTALKTYDDQKKNQNVKRCNLILWKYDVINVSICTHCRWKKSINDITTKSICLGETWLIWFFGFDFSMCTKIVNKSAVKCRRNDTLEEQCYFQHQKTKLWQYDKDLVTWYSLCMLNLITEKLLWHIQYYSEGIREQGDFKCESLEKHK